MINLCLCPHIRAQGRAYSLPAYRQYPDHGSIHERCTMYAAEHPCAYSPPCKLCGHSTTAAFQVAELPKMLICQVLMGLRGQSMGILTYLYEYLAMYLHYIVCVECILIYILTYMYLLTCVSWTQIDMNTYLYIYTYLFICTYVHHIYVFTYT